MLDRVHPGDWLRRRTGHPEWHRVARTLDYAGRLGEVTAPALVLCGRYDVQFAPACSEELAAGIPGARLVVFERSGHFPFVEEPAPFWTAVGEWLTATDASAGAAAG